MNSISPLKQARLDRGWSRPQVEEKTNGRITVLSLLRWETGKCRPRGENIEFLCTFYGKTPQELEFDRDIMGTENALTIQGENPIMSDIIRRSALSDLGGYLTSLISTWPRRSHQYQDLQEGVNRAVTLHSTLVGQDDISVMNRRQALMSLALVPIHLVEASKPKKADADYLLTHCAAGITACWYLRRGRDLAFVNDLVSTYISILQPTILSQSDTHRKAAAGLLAQCFGLKSKLISALQDDDQAIAYENEAIRYALWAESSIEQAISNREMALLYYRRKKYKQALPHAEKAYGLVRSAKDTPNLLLSFMASALSFCQAYSGLVKEAQNSLKEAHDLFDPAMPMPLVPYNEAILSDIDAMIYRRIGNFKEAINIYKQFLAIPDISPLGKVENCIDYAQTEVIRDDSPRDMTICVTQLTEGIVGAKELGSKWYIREARECYNLLRVAWPRENAVKTLGRDHFGL